MMSNKRWVLRMFSEYLRLGFTDKQLCERIPAIPPSTIRGCRKQLERSQLCEGYAKERNNNGRRCTIYRITERGKQFLESGQTLPVDKMPKTEHSLLAKISSFTKNKWRLEVGVHVSEDGKFYARFHNSSGGFARRCSDTLSEAIRTVIADMESDNN